MKSSKTGSDDEPRAHYDFTRGVRGKYTHSSPDRVIVVSLDPDNAKLFSDAQAVNDALRVLGRLRRARPVKKVAVHKRRRKSA
jgi:hypothetical protein